MPPWETDHLVWDVFTLPVALNALCLLFAQHFLSKLVKQVTRVHWTLSVNVVAQTRNLSGRKRNPELSLEACVHRARMRQRVGGSLTKTCRYCSPHLQPAAELLTFWCVVTHDGWYHHRLITTTCFIWNEPDVGNENAVMRETQTEGRRCARLGVFYDKDWNKRADVDDE